MRWSGPRLAAVCLAAAAAHLPEASADPGGPAVGATTTVERVRAADVVAGAWTPPRYRARVEASPSARFVRLARRLGAPGAEVENPCLAWAGRTCLETPLDPFFTALDELSRVEAARPVVVAAFGNSLIASDRIVDRVRRKLSARFGDGGRGLLLVDRLASYGPRARTGIAKDGWEARTLGELEPPPHPMGLAGVYHRAQKAGARSRFKLSGERRGTLWWLDVAAAAPMAIRVDGRQVAKTTPEGQGGARSTRFAIPPGAASLEVIALGPGAVSLGVVLEHRSFGVVLDTIGVPSADASYFLRADAGIFEAQLAERSPRLMLFMLGGNETKRLEWRRTRPQTVERSLRELIQRTRTAAPDSACLVVGPIDAVRGLDTSTPGVERPWLQRVNALQRRVALSEGCAFFDLYAAMGGEGALQRFASHGLVHDDLVHPRGRGLDLLGELLGDALVRAFTAATTPQDGQALTAAWRKLLGERDGQPPVALFDEGARYRVELTAPALREGLQRGLAAAGALPRGDADTTALRTAEQALDAAGLRAEQVRPLLVELGWLRPNGQWTRRGGLGLAALLLSAPRALELEAAR